MSAPIPAEAIDEGFVPVLRPEVFAIAVDEDTVLLDEGRLMLHVMNPTATAIAANFDTGLTVGAIALKLSGDFNADIEQVSGDVLTLLQQLGWLGLLKGVQGKPQE